MLNEYFVSVVIPVFNAEKYIGKCLDGLIGQTIAAEIICVDDGSTDNSAEIIRQYCETNREIRLISQPNCGAGAARNAGLGSATGKYVIFLDADDSTEPDMLELMAEKMEATHSDSAICLYDARDIHTLAPCLDCWTAPAELIYSEDAFSPTDRSGRLFQLVQGWPWDKMFRTEFIRKNDISFPDFPNSQDMVFVFQALAMSERICVVKKTLIHRSMNLGSSISNSRASSISSPFDAAQALIGRLRSQGILDKYKQSLYRFLLNFLIWHMSTLVEPAQKECYYLLKDKWSDALDIGQFPESVYDRYDYRKYRRIRRYSFGWYKRAEKLRAKLKRFVPLTKASQIRDKEQTLMVLAVLKREIAYSERTEADALLEKCSVLEKRLAEQEEQIKRLRAALGSEGEHDIFR